MCYVLFFHFFEWQVMFTLLNLNVDLQDSFVFSEWWLVKFAFCFKRGTPSGRALIEILCTCNGLVCSLQSHLCSFFSTYKKRNQNKNEKETKQKRLHTPERGELGPAMLFFLFSCLFVYFCFFGLLFLGFLVSCLYFLKRSQGNTKVEDLSPPT